jgi:beta-lactamase class A
MHKRVLLLLFFIPALLFTVKLLIQNSQDRARVAGAASSKLLISPLSSITPKESRLKEVVEGQMRGTKGSYGIVVLNLKDDELFFLNEHTTFKTGSLYKLWIMATAFKQIKDGTMKEDEVLSQDMNILYSKFGLASPSAQMAPQSSGAPEASGEPMRITFTVAEALEKMITISDNNAALLLTDRVRLANVALFLDGHGFSESMVGIKNGDPITTAFDMALFLKKLYKGEFADKEYTDKMITLLKHQRLNGKLPRYLPEGTVVAHKTGELDEFSHDVGMVYAPSGDYIISVLSESTSREQADERIANISKAVYAYFNSVGSSE